MSTGGQSLLAEADTKVIVEAGGGQDNCEVNLRILAVGGGGDGDAFTGNAGGSGHVVYNQVQ